MLPNCPHTGVEADPVRFPTRRSPSTRTEAAHERSNVRIDQVITLPCEGKCLLSATGVLDNPIATLASGPPTLSAWLLSVIFCDPRLKGVKHVDMRVQHWAANAANTTTTSLTVRPLTFERVFLLFLSLSPSPSFLPSSSLSALPHSLSQSLSNSFPRLHSRFSFLLSLLFGSILSHSRSDSQARPRQHVNLGLAAYSLCISEGHRRCHHYVQKGPTGWKGTWLSHQHPRPASFLRFSWLRSFSMRDT